jgi:pentatricopeptide repeat protein
VVRSLAVIAELISPSLERSVHIGTPKVGDANSTTTPTKPLNRTVDHTTRQAYVFCLKDCMTTMQLALNETAYTAIVKILSRNKEYETAKEMLTEAETVPQCRPKLRLYSSLLIAYCEEGRMVQALNCWRRITTYGPNLYFLVCFVKI